MINGLKNNEFTEMDKTDISVFLERTFVRLEAWFQWFNTTQSGLLHNASVVWLWAGNRLFLSELPSPFIIIRETDEQLLLAWTGQQDYIWIKSQGSTCILFAVHFCTIWIQTI